MIHQELSNKVIGAFYNVYNFLGYGFLEKVYENALMFELKSFHLNADQQKRIQVRYKEIIAGDYFADILVENSIILELKEAENICEEQIAQLTNYLKATEIELGILFNFGKKPEFKRVIFTNDKKKIRSDSSNS